MTDDSCVVFECVLDGRGGWRQIDDSPETESRAVWTHIDYSLNGSREWLAGCGLEPHVVDTLIREESRPRVLATETGLVIVLRGINRNAGADPEDMVSVRFWVEPDRMISVRQRKVMSASAALAFLERGNGPATIADLLTRLIELLADGIAVFVDDIEARIEKYDSEVETADPATVRSEISEVRRQVASVRRYLAPQRDALEALHRQGGKLLDEDQLYAVREQSDRIMRYIEDLDLVRERALVAQEALTNRVSEEQNARTYVLSIVAAIFLPITFISGVFGMNVAGLPGLENLKSFWAVSGVMLTISVGVLIWMRLKRWL